MDRIEWLYKKYFKHINGIILDAGCGNGELCERNIKKFIGVDSNKDAIKKLKSKGLNVRVVNLNKKLSFKSNSFDAISCIEVLEHLDNPEFTMKEFYRILKPNGIVIITVPCYKYHMAYHFLHKHFFHDKHDIKMLADRSGFNVIEKFEVRGLFTFIKFFGERIGLIVAKSLPKIGIHGIIYVVLKSIKVS